MARDGLDGECRGLQELSGAFQADLINEIPW